MATHSPSPPTQLSPTAIVTPASPIPTATATPRVAQREEPPIPDARQEVASVFANAQTWVLGGFDSAGRSSNSVFVFGTTGWSRGALLPQRVDHTGAAVLAGAIFYGGGFTDGQAQAGFFSLNLSAGWSALAPLHHARGAHSLIATAGKIFAIGGNGPAGNVSAVEAYDPATNTWSDFDTIPAPRNHVAGFAYRGLACVAGGRAPNSARVDCLDPVGHSWSQLPDLPSPTSGAGAGTLDEEIVVAGGENAAESSLVPLVFRFDGNAWSSEAMLVPRHGVQLSSDGMRLWACGGATAAGYSASPVCTSIG